MNRYNHLEEYVCQFLGLIDIYSPHQLNLENVYARLGLQLFYIPHNSMAIDGAVFLDNRKIESEQWEDFAHEICHVIFHAGDQAVLPLPMREYQEWKAENFAQHFCIPTFMLERLSLPAYEKDAVWMIMETFGVTRKFAEKRLRQYVSNLYSQRPLKIHQIS